MSKYHLECTKSELDRKKQQPKPEPPKPKDDGKDLLAVLNPDRACSCEVMARAVRSDVSKFIGLSEMRADMHDEMESQPDNDVDSGCPNAPPNPKSSTSSK